MSEKLETDIPALRASIESLHGLIDDGDMLLIDCVPDLLDVLDELERLRAQRAPKRKPRTFKVWVHFHGHKGIQVTGFKSVDNYNWTKHGMKAATLTLSGGKGKGKK